MRAEIRRIHNALGTTTIYVTHDQDEALSMADRIVVLRDGSIRQVGSPKDLYDNPAELEVAEFMGFRNRVTGRHLGGDGGLARLQVGDVVIQGVAKAAIPTGSDAVAVFRPHDLAVDPSGRRGLKVEVENAEYRGRDFVGTAAMGSGLRLTFRSPEAVRAGDRIALTPDPARVLIYPLPRSTP
jgi:putative spermidine/putrescine transport system ATP-binding protein